MVGKLKTGPQLGWRCRRVASGEYQERISEWATETYKMFVQNEHRKKWIQKWENVNCWHITSSETCSVFYEQQAQRVLSKRHTKRPKWAIYVYINLCDVLMEHFGFGFNSAG